MGGIQYIMKWEDLDNLVFVDICCENRVYVQFPEGSMQDTKIRLLNNGMSIMKSDWKYLERLNDTDYTIVIINDGNIFYKTATSIQSLELALLYIKNKEKLILGPLLKGIEKDIQFNTFLFRNDKLFGDKFEHKVKELKSLIDKNRNTDSYEFNLAVMLSFYTIHKSLMNIKNMNDSEILKNVVWNWRKSDAHKFGLNMNMKSDYDNADVAGYLGSIPKYNGIDPLYKGNREDAQKILNSILDNRIMISIETTGIQSLSLIKLLSRKLVQEVVDKTNCGIVIINQNILMDTIFTEWYVVGNYSRNEVREIVKETFYELWRMSLKK